MTAANERLKVVGYPLLTLVGGLALWEGIAALLQDPRLPKASLVLAEIVATPSLFLENTLLTVSEAAVGLVLAICVGFLIALVLVTSRAARYAFMPYVIAAQSIPLIAIAPLLAGWFGDGFFGRVVIVCFLCWFPTAINATRGMLQLDPVHVSLFRVHDATPSATLTKLQIPNSMPFLYSGIRISAGLAMIGAIVAEYGPVGSGLGRLIFAGTLEPERNHPQLFAAVLFSAAAGYILAEAACFAFRQVFGRYLLGARD